jgi:hypothetical protein
MRGRKINNRERNCVYRNLLLSTELRFVVNRLSNTPPSGDIKVFFLKGQLLNNLENEAKDI